MVALALIAVGAAVTKLPGRALSASSFVPAVVVPPQLPPRERADRDVDRNAKSPWCAGGPLFVLPDFSSEDGQFDLVLHFHGAADLVSQSYGAAHVNAVVVNFHLGIGSGVYSDTFAYKPHFGEVLEQARSLMAQRHLRDAKVRRVALSAFSAGFGAVERLLERPDAMETIDTVILLDGLHTGFDEHHEVDVQRIDPFVRFARAAERGDKLFFVTHSDIPVDEYVSTSLTADALLRLLGLSREPGGEAPEMPDLPSLGGKLAPKYLQHLVPVDRAEKNGFILRHYAGKTQEDHRAHLQHIATTAAPLLAARWSPPAGH
jgi:hypothetical protein